MWIACSCARIQCSLEHRQRLLVLPKRVIRPAYVVVERAKPPPRAWLGALLGQCQRPLLPRKLLLGWRDNRQHMRGVNRVAILVQGLRKLPGLGKQHVRLG
jgi:hypothetical protein